MTEKIDFVPDEILISRDRSEMRLIWLDGRAAALAASALRAACRCAWCTRDRILDRFVVDIGGVELESVEALGSHGLHLRFSDGHGRGIYPWPYLDELVRAAPPSSGVDRH